MSCGVGCRRGSDPAWLWLWCRPAAAAPIGPPSLGISICRRCGHKKKKKNRDRQTDPEMKEACFSLPQHYMAFVFRSEVPSGHT